MIGHVYVTSEDLFRREVLNRKSRGSELNSIIVSPPRVGSWGLIFSVLVVIAILSIILFPRFARVERIEGRLVPSGGLITISHPKTDHVLRVMVTEGDRVYKGQPLIELGSETVTSDFKAVEGVAQQQISSSRQRIAEALSSLDQSRADKESEISSQIAKLGSQIALIEQKIVVERTRVNNARKLYEQWREVESTGAVTKLQLFQQRDALLAGESQVKGLEASLLDLKREEVRFQGQLSQLPLEIRQQKNDLQRDLAALVERGAENDAKRVSIVTAPIAGEITAIFVNPGDFATPQENLANLMPANSSLLAELWMPASSIGPISIGDPVTVRLHAYPHQMYGQVSGVIKSISRSAISSDDVSKILGQTLSVPGPRYRVRVALDKQSLLHDKKVIYLAPGLTLDATIEYGRYSLLEWLYPDGLRAQPKEVKKLNPKAVKNE